MSEAGWQVIAEAFIAALAQHGVTEHHDTPAQAIMTLVAKTKARALIEAQDEIMGAHAALTAAGIQEEGGDAAGNEFALKLDERIKLLADRAPDSAPVTYRYRFNDPWTGNHVWRHKPDRWNGQDPVETQALYAAPQPSVVKQNLTTELPPRAGDVWQRPCGHAELQLVVHALRAGEPIRDEEGEFTDALEDLLKSLDVRRTAAPQPPETDKDCLTVGCKCQGCGSRYRGDLLVPDEVWERIKPVGKSAGGGLLCANCIMRRITDGDIWAAARAHDVDATPKRVSNSYTVPGEHPKAVALRVRFPWSPEWHYAQTQKSNAQMALVVQFHADAGNVAEPLYAAPPADARDAEDARRYRWLTEPRAFASGDPRDGVAYRLPVMTKAKTDADIDRAMGATNQGEQND